MYVANGLQTRCWAPHARLPNLLQRPRPRHGRTIAPIASLDTEGVQGLLSRDRRSTDLRVNEDAFAAEPLAEQQQQTEERPAALSKVIALSAGASSNNSQPRRSRQAIDAGMACFAKGDYREAIGLFQLALELPGSGVMRAAGSPKEYACASEGEEQAALYNMACCYARLGERPAALTCVEACLDAGFQDLQAIRSDPDLATLRGPDLEAVLGRRGNPLVKLAGGLFGGFGRN